MEQRNDENQPLEESQPTGQPRAHAGGAQGSPARRQAAGGRRPAPTRRAGAAKGNHAPERDGRPHQPASPRQYRAGGGKRAASRGRAAVPRGGASPQGLPGGLASLAPYAQEILLAAIALLAFISIIVAIATYTSPASGDAGTEPAAQSQDLSPAERVAAAETTTDDNGIVHGTTAEGVAFTIRGAGEAAQQEDKVTFAAVGDQIASDNALELADSYAGEIGDGEYDFKPFYQEVKSFIQQSDLRYASQETPLIGGQDGYPVSGYPTFISPDSCAEALADTGFNLVNFTTNHSYDAGEEGIAYSQEVWERYPQIAVGGSFGDQAARETVQLVERNGIRFAFLSYSYGDNSYPDNPEGEPNSYYAVVFDEEAAAADIARAKQVADCIIVSMHWGDEYSSELNDDQKEQAQWLADQDVDLVIGSHAHNIQPVGYYTGSSGNRIPVVFGLGDFVSGWTITDTILSGIFTCDFVRQDNGRVSVENPVWHPTIEWSDGEGQTYVRMLENMGADDIDRNTRTEDWPGSSFQHIYALTNEIITQIPVSWGADAEDKQDRANGDAGTSDEAGDAGDAGAADAAGNAGVEDAAAVDAGGAETYAPAQDEGETYEEPVYYDYYYDGESAGDGYYDEAAYDDGTYYEDEY